jgi:hypothetical protein
MPTKTSPTMAKAIDTKNPTTLKGSSFVQWRIFEIVEATFLLHFLK